MASEGKLTREQAIADIKGMVTPLFRDSGYRKILDPKRGIFGGTRPLRLWAPEAPIVLDGFVLQEVIAITEDGVIDDASGGGAMQSGYDCFPFEDLLNLRGALKDQAGRQALEPTHAE